MTNPLMPAGGGTFASRTDCLEWCDEMNRSRLSERLGRWYYVAEVNGVNTCQVLDGADGEAVRRHMDGDTVTYAGWNDNRMAGYRKWLHRMATKGVIMVRAREVE